jgi:6-phosphogluconolactonase
MSRFRKPLMLALAAIGIGSLASLHAQTAAAGFQEPSGNRPAGAVFVMSNDADRNEVIAFDRSANGSLVERNHFDTGGRGSGGVTDPLESQGSLTLSQDHSLLFAANAGSGTVSVFKVLGSNLFLTDKEPTGGASRSPSRSRTTRYLC